MIRANFPAIALILAFAGFQLHTVTMAHSGFHLRSGLPIDLVKSGVIEAFTIIAFGCFAVGLGLLILICRHGLGIRRLAVLIAGGCLVAAAVCVVIFVAIHNNARGSSYNTHHTATFVTAGACGLVSGILTLVAL